MENTVSVVIPSIGSPDLLVAIASVLAQSYNLLEIIVVDDSLDSSVDLRDFSADGLFKISTGGGKGPSASRNLGTSIAKGSWIAYLDEDDEWLPNKISDQISFAQKSGADLILTSAIFYAKKRSLRPKILLTKNRSPIENLYDKPNLFKNHVYLPMSSVIVRKEIASQFSFDENLTERENLIFLEKIYQNGFSIIQMREFLTVINFDSSKSISRIDLSTEIRWYETLSKENFALANNFALESSRNFIRIKSFSHARVMLKRIKIDSVKMFFYCSALKLLCLKN
jgi:glycosyltransferase involved in cell wall biosynthesis